MTTLKNYGWSNFQNDYYNTLKNTGLSTGRVISIKGFKYYLITEKGELETELSGKLLYGSEPENLPKVGDWVFYMDYESMGYIIEMFPRVNALSRKNPGNKMEKQVLASNVDYALIVQGLDRDFNPMRLERYRVQIMACGITPIVILNKADLAENPDRQKAETETLMKCAVFCCSTYTGEGLKELREQVLQKNKTYILLGSSGVGKSSLLNALSSSEIQKTGETSDTTSKGKHTTTTRDLFQLPNGSLMIDTPGMREFGLTFEEGSSSDELFPEIRKFAGDCKFPDCSHLREPGCSVVNALETGELDPVLYESYLKLIKEQRRFEVKIEDKKRLGKQFGRMAREAQNFKKKNKY
jgi:ribosome biogenesis GTPase